ncbi:uncharacterized protein [Haliotis cracherodii]|uniref:uncharacterized protein n=1 Tax=Haliotis cracherodii TaxID=6455 RepID=UPI0039E9C63C
MLYGSFHRFGHLEIMNICCHILWGMVQFTDTCMPELHYGRHLVGATFKIVENSSLFSCASECVSYGICKSFEFEFGRRACHLNGFDDPKSLEGGGESSDFIYSSIMNWNETTLGPCHHTICGYTQRCSETKHGNVTCDEFLPNIAKDKPTKASTAWSYWLYPPSVAVDGNFTASCFAVGKGDFYPWWQLDLLDTFVVGEIRVTNRHDFKPERLHDFALDVYQDDPLVYTNGSSQLCYMYHGAVTEPGKTVALQCTSPVTGRYLRLSGKKTTSRMDLLQFCEVQVFGFKPLQ